ncbi:MAG TPA: ribosome recycling factor [Candidatus Paceibacterota bacterium]|jgi:ribosome recycling factor|nr:ribosome recycling factor [Candidatus Paceibacterota bacterium]
MAYDFSKLIANVKETEEWLQREFSNIRTGRATPTLLDSVKPEIYGTRTPIQQVASITIEDARTLRIVPWDKSVSKIIETAINDADFGVSVAVDDQGLRVIFPMLTAERRTQLQKVAGEKAEQAKVTLRGHRTDALKELDAAEKEGGMGQDDLKRLKDEAQKHIDTGTEAIETLLKKKQEEITL